MPWFVLIIGEDCLRATFVYFQILLFRWFKVGGCMLGYRSGFATL